MYKLPNGANIFAVEIATSLGNKRTLSDKQSELVAEALKSFSSEDAKKAYDTINGISYREGGAPYRIADDIVGELGVIISIEEIESLLGSKK
jgi:hypothetical protein